MLINKYYDSIHYLLDDKHTEGFKKIIEINIMNDLIKKIKKIKNKIILFLINTKNFLDTVLVDTILLCKMIKNKFWDFISFLSYPVFFIFPVYIAYGKIKNGSYLIDTVYRSLSRNDLRKVYDNVIKISDSNNIIIVFDPCTAKNISILQFYNTSDYRKSVSANIDEADRIYMDRCKNYFMDMFKK